MNIVTQTRAAICATCPHHVHSDERPGNLPTDQRMAVCEISNAGGTAGRVPIPVRLTMGMCPIGKFPQVMGQASERASEQASGGKAEGKGGCGCKGKQRGKAAEQAAPGPVVVMWPRSARREMRYQFSRRTRRVVASEGWAAQGSLQWYGLPMPLRWWIMLRYGVVRQYEGCGCLVWLKRRAAWLDGPLGLLERFRLGVVAPVCAWWHSRLITIEIPQGTVTIDNPAWHPLPRAVQGKDGKGTAAAWVVAGLMMLAVLCLARAVV